MHAQTNAITSTKDLTTPKPPKVIWYKTTHNLNVQAYLDHLNWLHENIGTVESIEVVKDTASHYSEM